MSLPGFPLAILGIDPNNIELDPEEPQQQYHHHHQQQQQQQQQPPALVIDTSLVPNTTAPASAPEASAGRSRRAQSYSNIFPAECSPSTDDPPTYTYATRRSSDVQLPRNIGQEELPGYSCSVVVEAKVLINIESISPFESATGSEWKEVYLVLRGTLLSFYRLKDGGPGKLLRKYTLQHAEVGLAPDVEHTILIPKTRLAYLLPSQARRKACQRDPDLFRVIPQTIMRLRLETDQILLADASEDLIFSMIQCISAGIDLAPALDERSLPKQCTMPRRRRRSRQHNQQNTPVEGNLEDPNLLAEQQRIFRERYPSFAQGMSQQDLLLPPTIREEDELDLATIREEMPEATDSSPTSPINEQPEPQFFPRSGRSASMPSIYPPDVISQPSPTDFNDHGKWQPAHLRNPSQIQRYVKRCLPILLIDAARASDILIRDGRRVKVNWRMELLEDWELKPPTYRAHQFDKSATGPNGLSRTTTAITTTTITAGRPTTRPGMQRSWSGYSVSGNSTADGSTMDFHPPSSPSSYGGGADLEYPVSPTDTTTTGGRTTKDFAKFASSMMTRRKSTKTVINGERLSNRPRTASADNRAILTTTAHQTTAANTPPLPALRRRNSHGNEEVAVPPVGEVFCF